MCGCVCVQYGCLGVGEETNIEVAILQKSPWRNEREVRVCFIWRSVFSRSSITSIFTSPFCSFFFLFSVHLDSRLHIVTVVEITFIAPLTTACIFWCAFMHAQVCALRVFAPVCFQCPRISTADTQAGVKSSSDKLIISSPEERWLTVPSGRAGAQEILPAYQRPRGLLLNKAAWISFPAQSSRHIFLPLWMCMRIIYKNECVWEKLSRHCIYRSKQWRNFNAYEQVLFLWDWVRWHKIKAFMFCIAVPWIE